MPLVRCPTCSRRVEPPTESCPDCGTALDAAAMPEPTPPRLEFPPGQSFAGRYTIIEKIGIGGMGVVYKAIDGTVGSEVALKLIHPALSGTPSFAERFRREARVTRRITHPNVCRVHDIGESEGILYLSMEWIEGVTLARLLRQAGTLHEARALEIAGKIALGLEAAHAEGVIHRDLKPANVMIDTRGQVHVLDFGLAQELGGEPLSRPGLVIGTPRYMSPEQQRGEPLDRRTDLYSLGLVLREMLEGKPEDRGTSAEGPSHVHPGIAATLDRLLAPREDRCPSATEAASALAELLEDPSISATGERAPPRTGTRTGTPTRPLWRGVTLAAVAGILIAVGAIYVVFHQPRAPSPIEDSRARDFYERGLDYLRENLETMHGLDDAKVMFVRALDYEPESAVIMARLGEVYWRRYEKVPSEASRNEAEEWVRRAAAVDPELPELHNASGFGHIQKGEFERAVSELQRAVDSRPDFAEAWANLGYAHQKLGRYREGLEALDRAMQLERGSFRMFVYRGQFHSAFGEYAAAEKDFRRATELKADSPVAWNDLGGTMLHLGRFEEAIRYCRRSVEIEDNAMARSNLGTAHYAQGRFEESVKHFRRAAELQPERAVYWANLGDTLWVLERQDEAREAYSRAAELARGKAEANPLDPDSRMRLAQYCALAGREACALEHGSAAMDLQPHDANLALKMALIHCVLERDEESLDWLDRAVKLGASKAQIGLYPQFSRLRDDPRYRAILDLAS